MYIYIYNRLISIDISPVCTSWTKLLLSLTNLENKVDLYTGTLTDLIDQIKLKYKYINLIFLDHDKNNYLSDLLILESSGYINILLYNIIIFSI
jgi:predicted O-methyltransferase YrrM